MSHRVVLLECDDAHRPLLAVPDDAKVGRSGDPDCKCIVEIGREGTDVLYALHGVHLTMAEPVLGGQELDLQELLLWDQMWACGVPSLKAMVRDLGPADPDKVLREPPHGVAAWFDVRSGVLGPYVSDKGAVAVRLRVEPVSQEDSLTAVKLLQDAGGLHGHKYAIDALVAALALRVPAPVIVLTSDRDDWSKLCGKHVIIREV